MDYDIFDFDTGFFDHTERNTYTEDMHPQDVQENEVLTQINEEEYYEY